MIFFITNKYRKRFNRYSDDFIFKKIIIVSLKSLFFASFPNCLHFHKAIPYKFTLFIIFLLGGCQEKSNIISEYMNIYPDISGKRIEFPVNLRVINNIVAPDDLLTSGKKIVCTGDMDCSPCVLRLIEIEEYIKCNKNLLKDIEVIYIAKGEESEYFSYQIQQTQFSFPIYKDSCSSFLTKNGLENYNKDVFFINANNEIVLVGAPFKNPMLQDMYKNLIFEK